MSIDKIERSNIWDGNKWVEVCRSSHVWELEQNNELLRALLQRVVRETRRHRVDWTPASNWLATSHNGTPHYHEYRIKDNLLRDIKYALNPEQKEHDND